MSHFLQSQGLGNDTDHAPAFGQRGVGQHAHESDPAAAVDQAEAGPGDGLARTGGCLTVSGP